MELFANMSKKELKFIKDRTLRLEKENHSLFKRVKKQKEDLRQFTEKNWWPTIEYLGLNNQPYYQPSRSRGPWGGNENSCQGGRGGKLISPLDGRVWCFKKWKCLYESKIGDLSIEGEEKQNWMVGVLQGANHQNVNWCLYHLLQKQWIVQISVGGLPKDLPHLHFSYFWLQCLTHASSNSHPIMI